MAEFNYSFTCDTGQAVLVSLDQPKDRMGRPTKYGTVVWANDGAGGTATVVPSNDGMKAYLVTGDAVEATGFTVTCTDVDGSAHEAVTVGLTATEPDAAGAPAFTAAEPIEKADVPAAGSF